MAGAAITPLNTRLRGREAGDILRRSRATLLFTVDSFLNTDYLALLANEALPEMRARVLLGTANNDWEKFVAAGNGPDDPAVDCALSALRPDDLSDVVFTSGTTGAPKGVMSTHGRVVPLFRSWAETVDLRQGDRYLIVNPFFHTFGYKSGWMACLMQGVTAIPQSVFDVDTVLRRLADERVSILLGPPTVFSDLIRHPRRREFDLSRLRVSVPAAANVPPSLYPQLRDELGFDVVLSAYGLTESTSIVSTSHPSDSIEDIANSVGRPAEGIEVKLIDETGTPVATGKPGEILVRGYCVMRGYWEDEASTAATIDADGWLHTGDIGMMNERGFLKIVDRKKDMFIVGGFNAYPAEIENVLRGHDAVVDVAVIGVPDERMGEVGAAFVVAKNLTSDALISWASGRLANFKVPRHVVFVDALPRNASMKLIKSRLREQWAAVAEQ